MGVQLGPNLIKILYYDSFVFPLGYDLWARILRNTVRLKKKFDFFYSFLTTLAVI